MKNQTKTKQISSIIAPDVLRVNFNYLQLGKKYVRLLFVLNYPRFLASGWFSPIINAPELMDVALFIHPTDTAIALKKLRKKATFIEAQILERERKGLVRSPILETALRDVENLRDALQQGREKLFNISAYVAIYADSLKELDEAESKITNFLESRLIYIKPAIFQQEEAFNSILPLADDQLAASAPFNSMPAASFFPFSSSTLTTDEGVLYGVNMINSTLVIFDRFSLENANSVIFATSGVGKSYAAKVEVLRSLIMGTDVLVIDPEGEYRSLAEAVGGVFVDVSIASDNHINPFDIPIIPEDEKPEDVLRSHIVNLAGLLKLMLGRITSAEEALLDRALNETYAARNIVAERDFSKAEPPLLSDLEAVLNSLSGGRELAQRLYRFTKGSYAGFINRETNIDINNRFTVFSIRNLEEELRPIAMYVVLGFIWNLIRSQLKRRIIIVDEAWLMMKYPDGAAFMFGLVKRARKYYLGVTTITQDVEDFLKSPYGRPVITNSALQLLLKQHPAAIDLVTKTFNLTESERQLLLDSPIGEGLFFAGLRHVAIKVVASYLEDRLITSKPEELLQRKQ